MEPQAWASLPGQVTGLARPVMIRSGKIGDGDGDDPPDSGKSGMGPPTLSPDKSGIGSGMGIGASAPWCQSLSVLTST